MSLCPESQHSILDALVVQLRIVVVQVGSDVDAVPSRDSSVSVFLWECVALLYRDIL